MRLSPLKAVFLKSVVRDLPYPHPLSMSREYLKELILSA